MSGPKQHFLPRFMLAGFACRRDGREVWTFEFRRESSGAEHNTSSVGAQRNFYQIRDDQQVDEELKLTENEFGALVGQIRLAGTIPEGSADRVAALVTSLAVRTRAVRLSLAQAGQKMAAAFDRQLSDPNVIRGMLNEALRDSDVILNPIAEKLGLPNARHLPQSLRDNLLRAAETLVDSPETVAKMMLLGAMATGEMRKRTSKEGMKEIHLTALRKEVVPSRRLELVKDFRWFVQRYPPGSLILGDVGPIRFNHTSGEYEALINALEEPQTILLPISHEYLIVGIDAQAINDLPLDPEATNVAAAKLSWEFFVSQQSTDREEQYVKVLGRRADLLSDEELQRLEEQTFGRYKS